MKLLRQWRNMRNISGDLRRACGRLNELIEMTENNARYIRKFPDILLPIEEIERIIGINARRVLFNTHAC